MSALTPDGLWTLRESDRAEPAMLVAFLAGTALAVVHPVGLAVGAVLVGLVAPTTERAVVLGTYLASVAAGVLWLAAWLLGYSWSLAVAAPGAVVFGATALVAVPLAGVVRSLV